METQTQTKKSRKTISFPVGEFSTGDVEKLNSVSYLTANNHVHAGLAAGTLQFVRTFKKNPGKPGKPTNLYTQTQVVPVETVATEAESVPVGVQAESATV